MSGMIPEEALNGAFDYLANSSEEIGNAKGNLVRREFRAKRVFAKLYRIAEGNVEARKAFAMCHEDYAVAMEELAVAEETMERLRDQRNRAELILEVYRTQQATERMVGRAVR